MSRLPIYLRSLAAGAAALFASGSANAIPVYSASLDAELTLTEVSEGADVEVVWTLIDSFAEDDSFDDATSSAAVAASPSDEETLAGGTSSLSTSLTAGGNAAGVGEADSAAGSDFVVELLNNAADASATFSFLLDYSAAAAAFVDDPANQNAGSAVFLLVENSQEFDPVVELDIILDTDDSSDPFSEVTQIAFQIVLAPLSEATISLSGFVSGGVFSDVVTVDPIPVPAAGILFASVMLGAGLRRRVTAV